MQQKEYLRYTNTIQKLQWIQNADLIQRYKMKGKAEFDHQKYLFFSQEIIFFRIIFLDES